jgi:hypothetical protein
MSRIIKMHGELRLKIKNIVMKCKIRADDKPYSLTQRIITTEEGYCHGLFEDITATFTYDDCGTLRKNILLSEF